jgi:hypothetical protein
LRGFGDFRKFFDEIHCSPYRLNSAKIGKDKPRVRRVGYNVSFPNLEPKGTRAQVALNCLEKGEPYNQARSQIIVRKI